MVNRLDFVVGYSCNNRCRSCFQEDRREELRRKDERLDKTIEEIKREISEADPDEVLLTGGEPTIRDDFLELLRYAKKIASSLSLQTNARTFSDKDFAREVKEIAPDLSFATRFYSHRKKIHDQVTRVDGSWKETLQGVKNLRDLDFQNITLGTIILNANYKDLRNIVDFFSNLGVGSVDLTYPQMQGNKQANWPEMVPSYPELEPHLQEALKRAEKLGLKTIYGVPLCFLANHRNDSQDVRLTIPPYLGGKSMKRRIEGREEDIVEDLEIGRRAKAEQCRNCKFFNVCTGPWKEYFQYFSGKDLRPIQGEKIKTAEDFRKEIRRID